MAIKFIVDNYEGTNEKWVFSDGSGAPYVSFKPGSDEATLDGWFSIEDLEDVIAEIKKYLNTEEKS